MTERTAAHATFTIERTYEAPPPGVFAAWADPAIKRRWFSGSDEASPDYELDFQVGGRELNRGGPADGPVYTYEARYRDIVPDQRIVCTYEMYADETRISVSIATVQFRLAANGTRLLYTEQAAFLDGSDTPEQREHGTRELLEKLDKTLTLERSTR
jgi:uncharacterized protein YndB with AHSA1/START domain